MGKGKAKRVSKPRA